MEDLSPVLARLDRLERENRRWKRAGSLLGLALVVLFGAAFARPESQDKILRGEGLELTSPDGTVYARMLVNQGTPMFLLREEGKPGHVLLTLGSPAVQVRDNDGQRSAFLGFETSGIAKVELTGKQLEGARLSMKPDGTAGVYALDRDGYDRAVLEHASDGTSSLSVRTEKGLVRGAMTSDAGSNSSVVLLDPAGRRRIGTVVSEDGTPTFAIEDARARQRVNFTTEFDGTPKLEFLREDGLTAHRYPE